MIALATRLPKTRMHGALFGVSWSLATQVVTTMLKLASSLMLTRLLAPEAYALIGTAMVVLTTLEWLSDLGITPSLIRHPRGWEREWLLTGWWMNLARGATLSTIVLALAVPLGMLYRQPEVVPVLMAFSLRPLLLALRSPGLPTLRMQLNYRALFADEVTQVVVGVAVSFGVILLQPQAGVWALVLGTLSGTISGVLVTYLIVPIRPRWCVCPDARRELRRFGGAVLLNTLMMAIWLNADRLIAPRFLDLESLGLFVVASNLCAVLEALQSRLLEVYFSRLSRLPSEARRAWHLSQASRLIWLLGPMFAIAIAIAPGVIKLLYDARYAQAGPLFAWLLTRLMIRTIGQIDFQYVLSTGSIRPAIWANAIAAITQLVIAVPLMNWFGLAGLLVAMLAVTTVVTLSQGLLIADLRRGFAFRLLWGLSCAMVGMLLAALWG